jgi:hypothetical protein
VNVACQRLRSFQTAWRSLRGTEAIEMLRKGREVGSNRRRVGTSEIREQVVRHRGVVPYRSEPLSLSCIYRNGNRHDRLTGHPRL